MKTYNRVMWGLLAGWLVAAIFFLLGAPNGVMVAGWLLFAGAALLAAGGLAFVVAAALWAFIGPSEE